MMSELKHFLLFYDYAPEYMERRVEFRAGHMDLVDASMARDEFQLGGVFADPADGAVIMFKCADRKTVEDFVSADPYVKNGLVTSWRVREWTTVMGAGALFPFRGAAA